MLRMLEDVKDVKDAEDVKDVSGAKTITRPSVPGWNFFILHFVSTARTVYENSWGVFNHTLYQ